jgi:hypothetical protein
MRVAGVGHFEQLLRLPHLTHVEHKRGVLRGRWGEKVVVIERAFADGSYDYMSDEWTHLLLLGFHKRADLVSLVVRLVEPFAHANQ